VNTFTFENGVIDIGANNGTIWFSRSPMHRHYVGLLEVSVMCSVHADGTAYTDIDEVIVADGHDIPSMLMGIADKLELLEEQSHTDYDHAEGEVREAHFSDLRKAVQLALAERVHAKSTVATQATA
jgi:hypothetical protein